MRTGVRWMGGLIAALASATATAAGDISRGAQVVFSAPAENTSFVREGC